MSVVAAAGASACSNTISGLAAAGVDQVWRASRPGWTAAWRDWRPGCCQVALIRLINDGFGV